MKNLLSKNSSGDQYGMDLDKLDIILSQERIIEPYSEHEDYLEKDDFGKIISDLKSYAGR